MKQKILILLMALFSLPSFAQTEEVFYEYEGNTLVYVLNEQNLTCTTKRYSDIESAAMQLITNGNVVIPSVLLHNYKKYTVVGIGDNGFKNRKEITSIEIPNTVNYVGRGAFSGCLNLSTVKIADGESSLSLTTDMFSGAPVETIYFGRNWSGSFPSSISTVRSVEFGTNVTRFDRDIFSDCTGLTSMDIPNSVTSIGRGAFSGCSGLKSISIPNSVSLIEYDTFKGCSGLTSIEIPNSVVSIGRAVFEGCSGMKDVRIVDGEAEISIEYDVFSNCQIDNLYMGRNWSVGFNSSIFLNVKNPQIGNNVTQLPENAFSGCSELTSIDIPNSVTSIGERAFYNCSGLVSIKLPNLLNSIGSSAFSDCSGLTSIDIPNSVTSIGYRAFSDCSGLTSIDIPNSVTSIDREAFSGCVGLVSIKLSNLLTSIESSTFSGCSGLTSIGIPDSVSSIGYSAFSGCSGLTSLLLPPALTRIGDEAFKNCSSLTSVIIPPAVNSVGKEAFVGCSLLKRAAYPRAISNPFERGVTVVGYAQYGASVENGFVYGSDKTAILYAPDVEDGFEIPEYITAVGENAFYGCRNLTSITIPNKITSIGKDAFSNCRSLTSLKFNAENCVIGGAFPSSISTLTIGNKVTAIPDNFLADGSGIESLELPEMLVTIGKDAFRNSKLTSVVIPSSVTSVGEKAFYICEDLKDFKVEDGDSEIAFGSDALYRAPIDSLYLGKNWTYSGNESISTGIKSVVFGNRVTSLPDNAFKNCSRLTSVIVPPAVERIGSSAFSGCTGLIKSAYPEGLDNPFSKGISVAYQPENAVIENGFIFGSERKSILFVPFSLEGEYIIPNSVESIGQSAFNGCTALTSVNLPESVRSIGEAAFSGCTGLTSMVIPESVGSIGESAFSGCTALTSVNLPNSLASIEKSTFEGCSALTSVEIPQTVTSIGENAFKSCSALQSIIIPSQVASIGKDAFSDCKGLKKTLYPNTFDRPIYYGVIISYDPNDFSQEDGWAYNKDKSTLLFAPLSLTGECRVAASVDSIGEQAYANCGKITSLTIPGNVRSIGNSAFKGCDGIKSVVLEDGASTLKMGNYISYDRNGNPLYNGLFSPCPLESIYVGRNLEYDVDGKDAPFARQLALNSVSFGNGVTSISDEMFYGCTALASIEFPESVESVGAFVFVGCTGLDNVVLPSSVNSIGKQAFDGCTGLKEISLPASLSSLSVGLFNGCTNLVKVVLPASLEIIGNQAFNDCESLSEIVLPATLERIGRMAFYNCGNLKEIVLPASVSALGDGVFDGSTALSSIRCEGINPPAISETSVSNQYDKAHLFIPSGTISAYYSSLWRNFSNMNVGEYETKYYTDDVLKYLLVPDGTDHPSAIVVKGNSSALTEVTIPERFTDMSDPANPQRYYVTEIGYEAFKGLSKLQTVSFNSKSEVSIIGESAFEGCGCLSLISFPESLRRIENKSFYGCSLLLEVVFNQGLEYIGDYAFSKVLMPFITIPGSVKSIGDYAFSERNVGPYGADYLPLVQIVLGEGVETIGKGAFEIRSRGALLDKVSLPKSLKSIGANAFTGNLCPRIEISDLSAWCDIDFGGENANPTQYSSGDFPDYGSHEGYLYLNDKPLTNLVIPDGVKEVKPYAFNNLKTLKSVKFSDGVEGIGQKAFSSCDRLESISFNDGLSHIGEYAFSDCKKVGEISLPSSLASISAGAFYNTALNKVAIPAFVVELGSYAFNTVSEVTFEDGVNEINVAGGFSNMKNLVWGRPSAGLLTMSTKNLESLVIGNVAEEVPESLCSGASNLSSLTLGSGLKSIGDNAFKGCKLSEVIVPPSVETIGASAFEGNAYLSSIIMGHSVASIGEKAFNGCAANTVSITAQTPPAAPNTTFSNYTGKLYLQGKNAVDAYYDAYTCWDRFSGVVMIEPTGLDVNEKVVTGKAGDTFQLSAKLMPENVTLPQVFWRSTNPAIATVDGNGLVTLHADMEDMLTRGEEYSCKIIAESLYYDGPVAEIGVNNLNSGVEDVIFDSENGAVRPNDVYNMQGVCVKRNATQEDIDSLAPGLYIIGGKKVMIR